MKTTDAISTMLAAILALAPALALSGCGEGAEASRQEPEDVGVLKERQMEIMQKERNMRPQNKGAGRG